MRAAAAAAADSTSTAATGLCVAPGSPPPPPPSAEGTRPAAAAAAAAEGGTGSISHTHSLCKHARTHQASTQAGWHLAVYIASLPPVLSSSPPHDSKSVHSRPVAGDSRRHRPFERESLLEAMGRQEEERENGGRRS